MTDDEAKAARALERLAAHEALCTERWAQLRDSLDDHRGEFRAFRAWFIGGLVTLLFTVAGAFGWLVVERVLSK